MCIATFNHLALNPYIKLSLGLSSLLSYLTEGMDEKFVKQVHLDLRQILNGHYNIFMASEDDDEEVINHDGYLVYKGRLGKMKSLEIIKMVQSGELIEGEKVSDIFARLIYAENKLEAAAICLKCRKVFAKFTTSRNTFYTHSAYHTRSDDPDFVIPVFIKELMTESLAEMCATDMVPFYTVEKPGFRQVLQTMFTLSYNLGLQQSKNEIIPTQLPDNIIDEILPCSNTVKNRVIEQVKYLTPTFSEHVKRHIVNFGGAVSIDFTTKGSNYFVVTVHYLSEIWELEHWQLELVEYKEDDSSGASVLESFLATMNNHGIDRETVKKNVIITTDRGSNMINAFKNNFVRLDDNCHQASIGSKRVTEPYKNGFLTDDYNLPQDKRETVAIVSKLLKDTTRIIKSVNARTRLKLKLQDDGIFLSKHCEVRWLSRYKSINSFTKLNEIQREKIFKSLWDEKANGRYLFREAIKNIRENYIMLVDYCAVIEPFNHFIKVLEAETYCTVNRTLIEYHKLEIHFRSCLTRQNASVEMKAMAESGLLVLQYQKTVPTTVSDYHFLGLLLDPLRKDEMANFTDMTEEELRKMKKLFIDYVRKYNEVAQNPSQISASPFRAITNPSNDIITVEIDSFLNLDSSVMRCEYEDVLDFWRKCSSNYPHIAKLARRVLPITSSCPAERSFSDLGNTLTPQRLLMAPETVTSLLNLKNLKKFEKEEEERKKKNCFECMM
uniref:HAT C-terminal dimerisation domain-containing protein n=1 Tax=Panagrolaimus superbus TaxID=310955 RepID=A0A914XU64_9BILA